MPKIVDHDQYRKELLSQCFDLFAEKGYAALTMRQIAQGLGVSTGTLYHYFPSKEALFEQLVREMSLQDIQNAIAAISAHETTMDRVKAALEFIGQQEDYLMKQILIWIEFYQHQQRENGHAASVFQEVWRESEQEVAELLGFNDKPLMEFLGCAVDGILLHRIYEPEGYTFQDHARILLEMVKLYLEHRGLDK
jgi:AcrR family transcriptional regulator